MALKFFGKAENDTGDWFPFGIDPPFELRIRRIPSSVAEKIEERHRGRESFEVKDGIRRPVRELEAIGEALVDKAVWAWTDAKGLEVELADDESVVFFRKALNDETLQRGQVVSLSGASLTADVKRLVIRELRPFARIEVKNDAGEVQRDEDGRPRTQALEIGVFVVTKAAGLQLDFVKAHEADRGN